MSTVANSVQHHRSAPSVTNNVFQRTFPPREAALQRTSVQALLNAVTRVYPKEQAPPPPFCTTLRHYQKQSLAFMVDVEQSTDRNCARRMNDADTRGGWLCSEVGMGKSAVVIALVAANPMVAQTQYLSFGGRKLIKPTIILTSVSLIGQWED
jgi:SNF2 family DNA or RNA helicase